MTKDERKALAQETLTILERGTYKVNGETASLGVTVQECVEHTWCPPLEVISRLEQFDITPSQHKSTVEVINETTLHGAAALSDGTGNLNVGVLNFGSAKNPGGGFLRGTMAQEESLAYSSGLYASLKTCWNIFYAAHRRELNPVYSDRFIVSPWCVVFRNDDGSLRNRPYCITIVTCAAPNAAAIREQGRSVSETDLWCILVRRLRNIFRVFVLHKCTHLVLGAWGCGVFGNNPSTVVRAFRQVLFSESYASRFKNIRFSIPGGPNFQVFKNELEKP